MTSLFSAWEYFVSIGGLALCGVWYKKNYAYYKIIQDFKLKLPRSQSRAKILTEEEKEALPIQNESLKILTTVNLATQKVSLTEVDLDNFYNSLNNFNYTLVLNTSYFKNYTANLNRFKPNAESKSFDLTMVQLVIDDEKSKPLKPILVLWYCIKYRYKITSWINLKFIQYKDRKRNKTRNQKVCTKK